MMRPRSVDILRFSARGIPFGVAADAVERLSQPGPDDPHLGKLLALWPLARAGEQRALWIVHRGERMRVAVDGPIRFATVGPADVLPARPALLRRLSPILAFVREEECIVSILDVAGLLARRPGMSK